MNIDLPDIQNTTPTIKKNIYKVGINNYKIPLKLYYPDKDISFNTISIVSAYASLSKDYKGTNMSRFSEVITQYTKDTLCSDAISHILRNLKDIVVADNAYIKFRFNYLVKIKSPISKIESWFDIPIIMEGCIDKDNDVIKYITVEISYTSLCPCSKEISEFGAHNQRSICRIKVHLNNILIEFEKFKDIVDKHSSCQIYNTLKREDEKHVTEEAYKNPKFCEDVARGVASELDKWIKEYKIWDYVVVTEHQESIHQNNAISIITAGRVLK